MLHLGRRGYGDEGCPADVLEAFPHDTRTVPGNGNCAGVPQPLFSPPYPPWSVFLVSRFVASVGPESSESYCRTGLLTLFDARRG